MIGRIFYFLIRVQRKIIVFLKTIAYKHNITANGKVTFGYNSRIFNIQKNRNKININGNTFIDGELIVFNSGGEIEIGEYCFIGNGSRIWSAKKISIGNRVLISHNVNIHDNNSHPLDAQKRHDQFKYMLINGHPTKELYLGEERIVIEDDAWIGFNATILKGVTIGKGAVVGACSLVTKDVPANAVVVGNPARIIKYI